MNNISDKLDRIYEPTAMLVAYSSKQGDCFLETHEIIDGVAGAGKPASMELLSLLAKSANKDTATTVRGRIPENLLFADPEPTKRIYVWWNAPRKRMMTFDKKVGIPDGEYYVPGVIYVAKGRELSVYAFKGKRPGPNARLFMGPFFNYYGDCRVCLGTSRIVFPKEPLWDDILIGWEHIFWDSLNVHLISNPVVGDLNEEILKAVDKPFDIKQSVPCNMTFKQLLSKL